MCSESVISIIDDTTVLLEVYFDRMLTADLWHPWVEEVEEYIHTVQSYNLFIRLKIKYVYIEKYISIKSHLEVWMANYKESSLIFEDRKCSMETE